MTHLEATLKDFALKRNGDGSDAAYRFRLARCEDFSATMDEFKRAIPAREREPMPDANWLWEVDANPRNHAALTRLFDNFAEVYEFAKSQLPLF